MTFTNDPVADAERYYAEQESKLDNVTICEYCDEHIQDNYYFEINGECICEECLNEHYRKDVDDYD